MIAGDGVLDEGGAELDGGAEDTGAAEGLVRVVEVGGVRGVEVVREDLGGVEGERRERKDEGGDEPFHGQTGEGGDCTKPFGLQQIRHNSSIQVPLI